MKHFRPNSIDFQLASNCLKSLKYEPFPHQFKSCNICQCKIKPPRHLICFKYWTAQMVLDILCSAINLKCKVGANTHQQNLNIIPNAKVMILQEINEPMLNLAVSKAATLLGAADVGIIDTLVWEHDYNGRIFSDMSDIIFVSTRTHKCVQRFAEFSTVPVLCMMSRTHATIQSLATVMAIMEIFSSVEGLNIAYVGSAHPVLNSYLLLCPMLGANIKYKCCCKKCPVSPLLMNISSEMTAKKGTVATQCNEASDALCNASVVIAGPTTTKKDIIHEFKLDICEINKRTYCPWIFFHTCPRGAEVDDTLFYNYNAMTFNAFHNMHFIAAALMASHIRDLKF